MASLLKIRTDAFQKVVTVLRRWALLPFGQEEEEGEGGSSFPLWSPLQDSVGSEEAGLRGGRPHRCRALQTPGSAESVSFGKVHLAQEPRKVEALQPAH